MAASQLVFVAVLLCACLAAVAVIALASRHKKSAMGQLDLMGAVASVETDLEPEGSVLVRGELWRARLRNSSGCAHGRGSRVRVIGASGHLLMVEPLE